MWGRSKWRSRSDARNDPGSDLEHPRRFTLARLSTEPLTTATAGKSRGHLRGVQRPLTPATGQISRPGEPSKADRSRRRDNRKDGSRL